MDNEKKSFSEKLKAFFAAIGRAFVTLGKTLARWIGRMFMGASKSFATEQERREAEIAKEAAENENKEDVAVGFDEGPKDVEQIVSPGKQYLHSFFERKLAVAALVIVVAMFLFVFIGPLCMPTYKDAYKATNQTYLPPDMTMLSVPNSLDGHIRNIDSSSFYTIGLSDEGKISYWGVTKIGTTKLDIERDMPDEVKEAKLSYVAAGSDHAVAIGEDGTVYAWGHKELGQYIATEQDYESQVTNENIILMPESLRMGGKVDVANVKKLVVGNQLSIILMNDGSLYIWGNNNTYRNAYEFAKPGVKLYDVDLTYNQVYGVTYDQTLLVNYERNPIKLKYNILDATAEQSLLIGTNKIQSLVCSKANLAILVDEGGKNRVYFSGDFDSSYTEMPALGKGRYFVKLAAGAEHYLGLTNDGYVYAWGDNTHGQLKVNGTGNGQAADIYAESYQSYVLDADTKVIAKSGLKGYIFGTDANGASIFKRLVNGGRMTLTIGAVAVIISSIIGIIIGVLSGYFGGKVDMVLMRFTEVVSAIPFLPFAMILSAIMTQTTISENMRIFIIMCILGVLSWTGLARLVRGQVLATRECEYITAAKAMGVNEYRIAFKHILPNVISVIIVTLTLDFAGCMLTESSLSYLGFGVMFPKPTWGNMLNATQNLTIIGNYWWTWLFPSIFLAITTICINIIGDALRDVMDPRTNKR